MSSTLAPPPDTERPEPPPRSDSEERRSAGISERRPDPYRRALAWGLFASLLIHLVVLLVVSRVLTISGPAELAREPRLIPIPEGIEVVEVPAPAEPEPLQSPEQPPRRPDEQEVIQIVPGEPSEPAVQPPAEGPAPLTNAERLRPQPGDPRVWIPYQVPYPERLTGPYARADSAVRALLRDWLDSLSLSEEQNQLASEWLFGEGDKQWGIGPDGLHLGDIVIPIPFGAFFGESMSPNAERARALAEQWEQIRQQDIETDVRAARKERLEEMRKRSNEEAERQKDSAQAASQG